MNINREDLIKYINKIGGGKEKFRILYKDYAFYQSLKTETGGLLLGKMDALLENKLLDIINFKHNDQLKITENYNNLTTHIVQYKALIMIADSWTADLKRFNENLGKLENFITEHKS